MTTRSVLRILIGIAVVFSLTDRAAGGAWPQKKGKYFFKTSFNYLLTTTELNYTGAEFPISFERPRRGGTSFRDLNTTLYMEYGLTSRLTAIVNLPFKALTAEWVDTVSVSQRVFLSQSFTEIGLADLSLGLRFPILMNPFVLSLQGDVKLPLGYEGPEKADKESPPLGSGQTDFDAQLLFGRSLYPLPLYVTGAVGYRFRGGVFNDEYFYYAELGYQTGRLLLKTVVDGIVNTVAPQDIVGTPVFTGERGGGNDFIKIIGDQNVAKISPGLFYYLKPGLAVSGEILHVFSGKNTISGTIYSVGLILQN